MRMINLSQAIMFQGTALPFEIFVSQWLRMRGYLVQAPVNYRRIGGAAVKGRFWSDIDIVGTKGQEFVIVECKEWISPSKQKLIKEIEQKFENAAKFSDAVGWTSGRKVRFIFAQIEKDQTLEKSLQTSAKKLGKSIEYVDFNTIATEMIQEIRPHITNARVGKFGEPISWLLSRLIYCKFIK